MKGLLTTLARTLILDDAAYRDWHDRPNLFARGVLLILVLSLLTGIVTFGINLVARVRTVDPERVRSEIQQGFEQGLRFNPSWQQLDPEVRQFAESQLDSMADMIVAIAEIRSPLPQPVAGFLQALGSYLSSGLAALAGWLLYGAMALVVANLLGGSARLPEFLGSVAVYSIPGLLALFSPIPCVGGILALIGTIWGIVMYVKATSVATGLDMGKSTLAVILPFLALLLLAIVLAFAFLIWVIIIF